MDVKLSILVPVYNKEKYLIRCIESVLRQTYRDFEIVIVDDGSTDQSGIICDEYAEKYDNIRVVHKENGGLASARIAGIRASKGEHLGFVDSDDWINADMYAGLMAAFEDKDVDISIGGHVINKTAGEEYCTLIKSDAAVFSNYEALEEMFAGKRFIWSLCDKVYKRELFENDNVVDCWPDSYGEDSFVNSRVFEAARLIKFTPVYGYHYCMNDDSMIHAGFNKKKLAIVDIYLDIIDRFFADHFNIARNAWEVIFPIGLRLIHAMYEEDNNLESLCKLYQDKLRNYFDKMCVGNEQLGRYSEFLFMSRDDYLCRKYKYLDFIKNYLPKDNKEKVYIYGAGNIGQKCFDFFKRNNLKLDGFVVTEKEKIEFNGYGVSSYQEAADNRCCFVLGMAKNNCEQVIPALKKDGHRYIVWDWY